MQEILPSNLISCVNSAGNYAQEPVLCRKHSQPAQETHNLEFAGHLHDTQTCTRWIHNRKWKYQ